MKKMFFLKFCVCFSVVCFFISCKKDVKDSALDYVVDNCKFHGGYKNCAFVDDLIASIDNIDDSIKNGHKKLYQKKIEFIVDSIVRIQKNNSSKFELDSKIIPDIYLENHVNESLKLWAQPWASHLNYDEFCRFLLPYRICNEPFEDWRSFFLEEYPWLITLQDSNLSLVEAVNVVNDSCKKYVGFSKAFDKVQPLSVKEMLKIGVSNCHGRTRFAALMMRSIGLPVAVVYNREGHSWNVLLNSNGELLHFQGCEMNIQKSIVGIRAYMPTKIYMHVFHPNVMEFKLLNKFENKLPNNYINLFSEDVTSYFIKSADISIKLDTDNYKGEPVFLLSGRNRLHKWIPVDVSLSCKKNTATFNQIGIDNLYMCGYYNLGEMKPLSSPFYLGNDSTIKYFELNISKKDSVVFHRKTEMSNTMYVFSKQLLGCTIYGANKRDFSDSVQLHVIDRCYDYMQKIPIAEPGSKFRYFIFKGVNKPMHISELKFLDEFDHEIIGNIYDSGGFWNKAQKAFDENYATYLSGGKNRWFCIDAGCRKKIGSFMILARNNLNLIENGEEYELYYWDREWRKLQSQKASQNRVIYTDVPKNSIMYVACKNKGVESTMCWIQHNKPRWAVVGRFDKQLREGE